MAPFYSGRTTLLNRVKMRKIQANMLHVGMERSIIKMFQDKTCVLGTNKN